MKSEHDLIFKIELTFFKYFNNHLICRILSIFVLVIILLIGSGDPSKGTDGIIV